MIEPPGPLARWVQAARPRTLPAAVVPVVVGAASVRPAPLVWDRILLCAVVALALQVGTNYANDYSDGVRGTDAARVGPFRLTASGLVPARWVRSAAFGSFVVAATGGLALAIMTSWWLVAIGATAIAAGWFYTGGPRPYGYYGFGELFVFIYFGLVATAGTAFVQHESIPSRAWWLAVAVGAAACVMLEANNLRDVDGDRAADKRTVVARLGRVRGAWVALGLVAAIAVGAGTGAIWFDAAIAAALYVPALRFAFSARTGRELLPMLAFAARAQLLLGVVLATTCVLVH